MKALILALMLFLTGCNSIPRIPVITEGVVKIDPVMLQSCALLDTTPILEVDGILLENVKLYEVYAICARKQDDSIKLIKKFANIKE